MQQKKKGLNKAFVGVICTCNFSNYQMIQTTNRVIKLNNPYHAEKA